MLYSRRDKSANVATNLHIVAANLQTSRQICKLHPPVPELVNEPILKIGAVRAASAFESRSGNQCRRGAMNSAGAF